MDDSQAPLGLVERTRPEEPIRAADETEGLGGSTVYEWLARYEAESASNWNV